MDPLILDSPQPVPPRAENAKYTASSYKSGVPRKHLAPSACPLPAAKIHPLPPCGAPRINHVLRTVYRSLSPSGALAGSSVTESLLTPLTICYIDPPCRQICGLPILFTMNLGRYLSSDFMRGPNHPSRSLVLPFPASPTCSRFLGAAFVCLATCLLISPFIRIDSSATT
ncbi:hypothetical protein IF1G_07466 [Cordyceps javanica]|uniref:Uncharacterized protein n=1 Tax=Cordyceps javanica TaxID=43265 RepID=A0A545UW96_9HYPO|nr:hypothetical protein IF1G_07466 [Cordyceps javanica]